MSNTLRNIQYFRQIINNLFLALPEPDSGRILENSDIRIDYNPTVRDFHRLKRDSKVIPRLEEFLIQTRFFIFLQHEGLDVL